jgi:hypothetical protein
MFHGGKESSNKATFHDFAQFIHGYCWTMMGSFIWLAQHIELRAITYVTFDTISSPKILSIRFMNHHIYVAQFQLFQQM